MLFWVLMAARNGINQTRGTISPFLFLDDKYLSVENLKGLTCNLRLQVVMKIVFAAS